MFVSLARLFLVSLLALPAFAAPEPTRTEVAVRNYNPIDIVTRSLAQAPAVPLTNAQRLSRGLPPNRPRSHYGRRVLHPRQSSTCQPRQGTVQVLIASPAPVAGFLSRNANSFGEYEITTNAADAMQISVCNEVASGADTFDILSLNGLANFPSLGAAVGFASTSNDLQPGSLNYAYIVGTTAFPRGPAVVAPNSFSAVVGIPEGVETNIWTLTAGNQLVPSWVNTDGSVPAVQLVYVSSSNSFAIVGDLGAFQANFGPVYTTTFTFVPAS